MRNALAMVSALVVASSFLLSCGGTTQSSPGADAGKNPRPDASVVDAYVGSPACTALAACCESPTIRDSSSCVATALSGALTNSGCAMELAVYQANGLCPTTTGPSPGRDGSVSPIPDAFVPPPPPDAFVGPSNEGGPDALTPPSTVCTPACAGSQVCGELPGANATCVAPCQSDGDCPALMTCAGGGVCSYQCTTCPAGQQCGVIGAFSPSECSSNGDCPIGTFCAVGFIGMCQPYEGCVTCVGECPKCTNNSQCAAGQICANEACVTCSSNTQCGSSATASCTATRAGMQCTCTASADCSTGQSCQSGLCAASGSSGCGSFAGAQCENGQACVNDICGPCTTFADCNTVAPGSPQGPAGLACRGGTCTACTANSQCGGGMACVGGTCGTCSTDTQCGPSATCVDGFCTCTADTQCATGQRCGSGICVAM